MSAEALNVSMNFLEGVLKHKKNKQQHANDLAQQAANNAAADVQGGLAMQSLFTSNARQRRELGLNFLKQQKQAMAKQGSAAVQAAWAGIEGATSNDLMQTVMQEAAQLEVDRDENLRAIHESTVNKTADIIAGTNNNKDFRNFTKPDVLAQILGVGQNILSDYRKTGKVG